MDAIKTTKRSIAPSAQTKNHATLALYCQYHTVIAQIALKFYPRKHIGDTERSFTTIKNKGTHRALDLHVRKGMA